MRARRVIHLVLFLFTFGVEVRAIAAENVRLPALGDDEVTEQPRNCLKKISDSCAVATFDHQKYLLKIGEIRVWLDENSSVVRLTKSELSGAEQNEIRVLRGQIWVHTPIAFRVSTGLGAVVLSDASARRTPEFWVRVNKDETVISATTENVMLEPRGSKEELLLPAGLENKFGLPDETGVATTGVPMPVAFAPHINRWAKLYPGKLKQFEDEVEKFHARWLVAARLSAEINQAQVQARLMALDDTSLKAEQGKSPEASETLSQRAGKSDVAGSSGRSTATGSRDSAGSSNAALPKRALANEEPPVRKLTNSERRQLVSRRVNELFRQKFLTGE